MFFIERVKAIEPSDRVLEVGPGGAPHPRSDVLLEVRYPDATVAARQRGNGPPLQTDKPVIFFDGSKFPFVDDEFDYVICSHVLEHVEDVEAFVGELVRVASRGYIEFPTIYYDYLYNFPEHISLLFSRAGTIHWLPKSESGIERYQDLQAFFRGTLDQGYTSLVNELRDYLFQGFEWFETVELKRARALEELIYHGQECNVPKFANPAAERRTVPLQSRLRHALARFRDRLRFPE